MIRRVLSSIPEARYCPAPDCGYAVLAPNCSKCPMLTCMRVNCKTSFCFNCRDFWHSGLSCEESKSKKIKQSISNIELSNSNNNLHNNVLIVDSSPDDIFTITSKKFKTINCSFFFCVSTYSIIFKKVPPKIQMK